MRKRDLWSKEKKTKMFWARKTKRGHFVPKYSGTPPENGWAIGGVDGWTLFVDMKRSTHGFFALKLVADEPTAKKANYNLMWSPRSRSMLRLYDQGILDQHLPDLALKVVDIVSAFTDVFEEFG